MDGPVTRTGSVAVTTLGCGLAAWLVGSTLQSLVGDRYAPWLLGRAAGVTSFLLLAALVATGLLLSHPHRSRWRLPHPATRIRLHVSLAAFTLAFTVLHVVVLATDDYARVGWWGALLPMASHYRPLAVTFGVLGTYAGLLAGLTAALAGRWTARIWWPVHRFSAGGLVLVAAHGVLAGTDTPALLWLYLLVSALVGGLAVSRYTARSPAPQLVSTR